MDNQEELEKTNPESETAAPSAAPVKVPIQPKTKTYWFIGGTVLIVLILVGAVLAMRRGQASTPSTATTQISTPSATLASTQTPTSSAATIQWSFDGKKWQALGTPPACPSPISLTTPVDISKATAILYPGQTRGGNYKAHGGFLFATSNNSDITVKAPLDAQVYKASRYIEQGEVQYLFVFVTSCGIMYRFDHLNTLSPTFQALADTLPAAQENNSTTTNLSPYPSVKVGDIIATAVGFKNTKNVTVDFGLYDLRQPNAVSQTAIWQAAHPDFQETNAYGVCWLDLLSGSDAATAKNLPGGDQRAGKQSDFCK